MLVLKFFRQYGPDAEYPNSSIEKVVSCETYEKYNRGNGIVTITAYRSQAPAENNVGVDYHIATDENMSGPFAFHVCYIENSSGKTIDRVSCHNDHF